MEIIENPNLEQTEIIQYPMQGGYVYILETKDEIKIGRSKNLKRRINEIKTTSGKEILNIYISQPCEDYCYIENEMHKIFKNHRVIGEWFNARLDDVLKQLEKFTYKPIIHSKYTDKTFKICDKFTMDYLRETEPIIYKFLKENNYNVFYDENQKQIYISGFDNGEYFEMLFDLFMSLYVSNITKV